MKKSCAVSVRLMWGVLCIALLLRFATLNCLELLDPTESRYAVIAQHMVQSGDWITPRLPMPGGLIPYLGKPPFHFWLTSLSFLCFGFQEWAARLSGMLCAVTILVAQIWFARRFLDPRVALTSALITLSSGLFFFFAGSSVVDVTLSACTFVGTLLAFAAIQSEGRERLLCGVLSAIAVGAGFLTKGPVAIALVGGAFALYSLVQRDFSAVRRFPWLWAGAVFLIVVTPWFFFSSLENSGFLKYFFWNENVGRYLFKNYGDRYGSGHRYPWGTSWWMLAVGLLPWTPVLLHQFYVAWRGRKTEVMTSAEVLLLCCGLVPMFFFTFVRQLQVGYVVPAIPGLMMWLTARSVRLRIFSDNFIAKASLGMCVLYGVVIAVGARWLNPLVSSAPLVRQVIARLPEDERGDVGVISSNTFSHYWQFGIFQTTEKSSQRVRYLDPGQSVALPHLLIKRKELKQIPEKDLSAYEEPLHLGAWLWFDRRVDSVP